MFKSWYIEITQHDMSRFCSCYCILCRISYIICHCETLHCTANHAFLIAVSIRTLAQVSLGTDMAAFSCTCGCEIVT